MNNWTHRLLLAAVVVLLVQGCGSEEDGDGGTIIDFDTADVTDTAADTPAPDADVSEPDADTSPPDVGPDTGDRNVCGGSAALLFDGAPATPGEACGCGGIVVCEDGDSLACLGASEPNECGGCSELPAAPDAPCGPCGAGTYTCDGTDAVVCTDASALNACGGCAVLDATPDAVCDSDDGIGLTKCIGLDDTICLGVGRNDCGGPGLLDAYPGAPCGVCSRGTTVCDGRDGVACVNEDAGVNACGGCAPLRGNPGDGCGECGGVWACDPDNPDLVVCSEPDRNACGGCADFGADLLGGACDEGVFHCRGYNALQCGPAERNACGGLSSLDAAPGEACGECGDGRVVCASPEAVTCVGATGNNACGGCGLLPGVPGEACAFDHRWACDDGALSCRQVRRRTMFGDAESSDGFDGVRVVAPAGATTGPTPIMIELSDRTSVPGWTVTSPVFRFLPDGLELDRPITVRIASTDAAESSLVWSTRDGTDYATRPDSVRDGDDVVATVDHFSEGFAGFPDGEVADVCGDGAVTGDEECDDGNTVDGDGCSADCVSEGVICDCPEGQTCDEFGECVDISDGCGNGRVDPGELCDGDAFGPLGSTCEELGGVGGDLSCTESCEYDLSACSTDELCDDGVDNDGDGDVDCDDGDCAGIGSCGGSGTGGILDACNGVGDRSLLGSGTVDATGEAQSCGLGCLGDADPGTCTASCVSDATGLTEACSACWGDIVVCTISACLAPCASDPGSPACRECVDESCPSLELCTGVSACLGVDCGGDVCVEGACVAATPIDSYVPGSQWAYVREVYVPPSDSEAPCCVDFDGDGELDNGLATLYALTSATSGDPNVLFNDGIVDGSWVGLLEFDAWTGATTPTTIGWWGGTTDLDGDGAPDQPFDPDLSSGDGVFRVAAAGYDGYAARARWNVERVAAGSVTTVPAVSSPVRIMMGFGAEAFEIPLRRATFQGDMDYSAAAGGVVSADFVADGITVGGAELAGYILLDDLFGALDQSMRSCTCAAEIDGTSPVLVYGEETGVSYEASCVRASFDTSECSDTFCFDSLNLLCSFLPTITTLGIADMDTTGDGVDDAMSVGMRLSLVPATLDDTWYDEDLVDSGLPLLGTSDGGCTSSGRSSGGLWMLALVGLLVGRRRSHRS